MPQSIHQAEVRYADGSKGLFLSTDGTWFYEHKLPNPHSKFLPFSYEREWLKRACAGSRQIDSIEFMEVPA